MQPVVQKVAVSKRLRDSPAVINSNISSGMRQMMMMMQHDKNFAGMDQTQNLTLEINKDHPLIVKLNKVRKHDTAKASLIVR